MGFSDYESRFLDDLEVGVQRQALLMENASFVGRLRTKTFGSEPLLRVVVQLLPKPL